MKTEQEHWDQIQELFHSLSPLPPEGIEMAREAVERALAELKAFLPAGSPMMKRLDDAQQ